MISRALKELCHSNASGDVNLPLREGIKMVPLKEKYKQKENKSIDHERNDKFE